MVQFELYHSIKGAHLEKHRGFILFGEECSDIRKLRMNSANDAFWVICQRYADVGREPIQALRWLFQEN